MAKMFVSGDNPGLLKVAAGDLQLANCMLWCISLNVVATTYFQSIGKPATAIILSTLRQGVCLLPVIWFLPYFMEDHEFAIWLSMPISDVACCLMTIVPVWLHYRFMSKVKSRG
jgi:Na+-driven multidrug efflux pump